MNRTPTLTRASKLSQTRLADEWDAVAAARDRLTTQPAEILARVPLPEPCSRCGGAVERVERYVEPGRGYLVTITCSECGRSRPL